VQHAVLDAALDMGIGKSMSVSAFDSDAYARMSGAMARADL